MSDIFSLSKRLFPQTPRRDPGPVVFDSRLHSAVGRPEPVEPEWVGDLDSLFKIVDAQMVDRRAPRPPGSPSAVIGGRRVTDPEDEVWIGFGIEEYQGPSEPRAAAPAARPGPIVSAREVADLVIAALRQEMREQIRTAVNERVDQALKAARTAAEPPKVKRTVSRKTILSIRIHRPLFFFR